MIEHILKQIAYTIVGLAIIAVLGAATLISADREEQFACGLMDRDCE